MKTETTTTTTKKLKLVGKTKKKKKTGKKRGSHTLVLATAKKSIVPLSATTTAYREEREHVRRAYASMAGSWLDFGFVLRKINADKLFKVWGYKNFQAYVENAKDFDLDYSNCMRMIAAVETYGPKLEAMLKGGKTLPSYVSLSTLVGARKKEVLPTKQLDKLESEVFSLEATVRTVQEKINEAKRKAFDEEEKKFDDKITDQKAADDVEKEIEKTEKASVADREADEVAEHKMKTQNFVDRFVETIDTAINSVETLTAMAKRKNCPLSAEQLDKMTGAMGELVEAMKPAYKAIKKK